MSAPARGARTVPEGIATFARAMGDSDLELLRRIAAEDVQIIDSAAGVLASGSDGLDELFGGQGPSGGLESYELQPEAIMGAGETTQAAGTWIKRTRRAGAAGGPSSSTSGQFVQIWKRTRGRWLLLQHVVLPAAPVAPGVRTRQARKP